MNKNKQLLDSFIEYCKEHQDERFWQALKNWAHVNFILTADYFKVCSEGHQHINYGKDTFYWEEKNK